MISSWDERNHMSFARAELGNLAEAETRSGPPRFATFKPRSTRCKGGQVGLSERRR